MFFQSFGKNGFLGRRVGKIIPITALLGRKNHFYGFQRRIGNRSGRKSFIEIGIVGKISLKIGSRQRRTIQKFSLANAVNHRSVYLKRHPNRQSLKDDPGNYSLVIGQWNFFFNQRGNNNCPVNIVLIGPERLGLFLKIIQKKIMPSTATN